jgi:hypothetical protein
MKRTIVIVMDGIQANNYRGGAGDIFFLSMYLTMNMGTRG